MKRVLLMGAMVCPFAMSGAGCYWLASYKDLTSGIEDADSGSDASNIGDDDAGSPFDSAPVARDSAPPGPFCPPDSGPLTYCMDFDGVDASAIGLGAYLANASIVTGTSVSPPSSLSVTLNGKASNGEFSVPFSFQPTVTRLEFQALTIQSGQWVTLSNISLVQDSPYSSQGLNVVVNPQGQFQVQEYIELSDGGIEQGGPPAALLDGGAPFGTWHHIVLTLTVDPSSNHFTSGLVVDDQALVDDLPLEFPWFPGNVRLNIGVTYGGGSGPQFFFDNVRADFTVPPSSAMRPSQNAPRPR